MPFVITICTSKKSDAENIWRTNLEEKGTILTMGRKGIPDLKENIELCQQGYEPCLMLDTQKDNDYENFENGKIYFRALPGALEYAVLDKKDFYIEVTH